MCRQLGGLPALLCQPDTAAGHQSRNALAAAAAVASQQPEPGCLHFGWGQGRAVACLDSSWAGAAHLAAPHSPHPGLLPALASLTLTTILCCNRNMDRLKKAPTSGHIVKPMCSFSWPAHLYVPNYLHTMDCAGGL